MSINFAADMQAAFSWLIDDGFSVVKASPTVVQFSRPPVMVEVSWEDGGTQEVFVTVGQGDVTVALTYLRMCRGDIKSFAGRPDWGDIPWSPTVRTEQEAARVLAELSEHLTSFRSTALNPDGAYLLQADKVAESDVRARLAEPRWIKAARFARIFEEVGDWGEVVKQLNEFEPQLDDQTRALLERGRDELKKSP